MASCRLAGNWMFAWMVPVIGGRGLVVGFLVFIGHSSPAALNSRLNPPPGFGCSNRVASWRILCLHNYGVKGEIPAMLLYPNGLLPLRYRCGTATILLRYCCGMATIPLRYG